MGCNDHALVSLRQHTNSYGSAVNPRNGMTCRSYWGSLRLSQAGVSRKVVLWYSHVTDIFLESDFRCITVHLQFISSSASFSRYVSLLSLGRCLSHPEKRHLDARTCHAKIPNMFCFRNSRNLLAQAVSCLLYHRAPHHLTCHRFALRFQKLLCGYQKNSIG